MIVFICNIKNKKINNYNKMQIINYNYVIKESALSID